MLSSFISMFVCDNLMYKIIDNQIEVEVKNEIIQIIKSCFENFILIDKQNLTEFQSYYDYFELQIQNELSNQHNSHRRMALSTVILSFVNYSIVNWLWEDSQLDSLESLGYKVLGL